MIQNFADRVTVRLENHVAHVLLDRADKMNALDDAMFEAVIAAGDYVRTLPGVRAVVLSGEGADEIFGGYLYFHKAPSPGGWVGGWVDVDRWGSGFGQVERGGSCTTWLLFGCF